MINIAAKKMLVTQQLVCELSHRAVRSYLQYYCCKVNKEV